MKGWFPVVCGAENGNFLFIGYLSFSVRWWKFLKIDIDHVCKSPGKYIIQSKCTFKNCWSIRSIVYILTQYKTSRNELTDNSLRVFYGNNVSDNITRFIVYYTFVVWRSYKGKKEMKGRGCRGEERGPEGRGGKRKGGEGGKRRGGGERR